MSRRVSLGRLLSASLLVLGLGAGDSVAADEKEPIVVFAAASLRNVLDAMLSDWHDAGGERAVVSYAGTSALARQIEQGAPAHLLISADDQWMQYLVAAGAVQAGSVGVFARNRVVLIAPANSINNTAMQQAEPPPVLDADFPLAQLLGSRGRLAMANPAHVPAGRYGKAALERVGLFGAVNSALTRSANVRLALALVARGECPVGVVYASDAHVEPAVRVIGRFESNEAAPVIYPVALVKDAGRDRPGAARLLKWLLEPARGEQLQWHGLLVPGSG